MLQIYWRKISRHSRIIKYVTLITFLLSMVTYSFPRTFYVVRTRYIVAQDPLPITETDEEARQFLWRTSEYIVFGLSDWVDGTVFTKEVIAEMEAQGVDPDKLELEDVMRGISSNASRSQLLVTVQDGDEDHAKLLASSVQKVIEGQHSNFIPQLELAPAQFSRVDGDLVEEVAPSLSQRLSIFNNLLFAVFAGIFAAIAVEMFTPRLDSRREAESLGVTVLGQIPKR